jgi:transposase
MRICKDKKAYRYQMVIYAQQYGNKPAAKAFNVSVRITRKWRKRYEESGYDALADQSQRPHRMPNATPDKLRKKIVHLRKKYKRLGAIQVKVLENIPASDKTIRKIWREEGVNRGKRRKKHLTKQNLREVKKLFKLFSFNMEDTKHLNDIPEYWPLMKKHNLPRYQYTFREISCGIKFLGFSNDLGLTQSTLFAQYINNHLEKHDLLPKGVEIIRQTDNGSEYCGSWNAKEPSSYTLEIERLEGQVHRTIFPGAHRQQSDVETVHDIIETEFYEIEDFVNRNDFFSKAFTYQTFFNLERPNTYKENKSPWQLAKDKIPTLTPEALILPPIDLDYCIENLSIGGYHVSSNPLTLSRIVTK